MRFSDFFAAAFASVALLQGVAAVALPDQAAAPAPAYAAPVPAYAPPPPPYNPAPPAPVPSTTSIAPTTTATTSATITPLTTTIFTTMTVFRVETTVTATRNGSITAYTSIETETSPVPTATPTGFSNTTLSSGYAHPTGPIIEASTGAAGSLHVASMFVAGIAGVAGLLLL